MGVMRIVHVFFSFEPGGSELMMWDVMNRMCSKPGYEIHLLVINNRHSLKDFRASENNVHIHLLNRREGSRNPWWLLCYNKMLWKLKPDVVHFHNSRAAFLTLKQPGVVFVQTLHTTSLNLKGFYKIDRFISISQAVDNDLKQREPNAKSIVITNGVDTESINFSSENRREANGDFRVLQLGRIVPAVKGQDILIRALRELPPRYRQLVRVDFIGQGNPNPLRNLAEELGVDDKVTFLGEKNREEIYARLLAHYHLLVHPSRIEGFGLAIAEAMTAGIPVLVSSLEAPMDIIQNGHFGDFFVTDDPVSLARAIEKIIDHYPAKKNMAAIAREHARQYFSIERMVDGYLEVYHSATKR